MGEDMEREEVNRLYEDFVKTMKRDVHIEPQRTATAVTGQQETGQQETERNQAHKEYMELFDEANGLTRTVSGNQPGFVTYIAPQLDSPAPEPEMVKPDPYIWEAGKEMAIIRYRNTLGNLQPVREGESISADDIKEWMKKYIRDDLIIKGFLITDEDNNQLHEDDFPVTNGIYTIKICEKGEIDDRTETSSK